MGLERREMPVNLIKDMVLRDGSHVTIRPIRPTDAQIEWDFVHNLSYESRYNRFMSGVKDLTPYMVKYFTHIDFSKDMALIATKIDENHREREIAVGRYFKLENSNDCEFAIVVDDNFQAKGIGQEIMRMLIADAKSKGYVSMIGNVLSSNRRMLDFIKDLGFHFSVDINEPTVVKATLDLSR